MATCGTFPWRSCSGTPRSPRSMKAPAKSSGSSSPAVSIPKTDHGRKPGERRDLHLFALLAEHEHEQASFAYEPSTGYRGIIANHSTVLGPSLGGTRFWSYETDTDEPIDSQ